MNEQTRFALKTVWIILSVAVLMLAMSLALLSPEFLYEASALAGIPHDTPCPLCGMTRSFVHLSRGDSARAFVDNRLGPFLFVFLAVNEGLFLCWVLSRVSSPNEIKK